MSLYNIICKGNPAAGRLLALIDLDPNRIPRLRDVYFRTPNWVVVFTRTGGGNREHYQVGNEVLRQHPLFDSDWDDDFDCTFAHWWYKISEEQVKELEGEILEAEPERFYEIMESMSEFPMVKFNKALEAMKKKGNENV